jgi:long-chain acyl-CoA synthetase
MATKNIALHELLYNADPKSNAIIDVEQDRTLTYRELINKVEGFASYLAKEVGLTNNECVSIFLPNSWQYVVSLYAVSFLGCIAVPIDYRLTETESSFIIKDTNSSVLICDTSSEKKFPHAKKVVIKEDVPSSTHRALPFPSNQSNPLCVLYTGGTTGKQKGAILTHKNFIYVLSRLSEVWGLRRGGEVFLQFLPMTHSGGLNCGLNSSIFSSGCTVIMRRFDPLKVIDLVNKFGVTVMPAVPTVYNELIKTEKINNSVFSSLKVCFCSGATLPKPVAEKFKEKTGITINVGWGLTEASPQLTVCPLGIYKENMVGLPLNGTTIFAFDEERQPLPPGQIGELGARGPQIMVGYWNRDEETRSIFTEDGFLLTGDIGYVDSNGFVYLLGRKKNMINTGGYKVWPEEIESVLMENPKVKEAAVVGVPDEKYGEVVKAFIVIHEEITKEEVIEFLRKKVASYKLPRYIEFTEGLPKSSVGKILHRLLRERGDHS